MSKPWVGWLAFAVLAVVVLVSSCQAMGASVMPAEPGVAGTPQGPRAGAPNTAFGGLR